MPCLFSIIQIIILGEKNQLLTICTNPICIFIRNYLFLSASSGGSLADVLFQNQQKGQYFSEPELKQLLYQLVQGLHYIHSQGLVHLDIKPGITSHYYQQKLSLFVIPHRLV